MEVSDILLWVLAALLVGIVYLAVKELGEASNDRRRARRSKDPIDQKLGDEHYRMSLLEVATVVLMLVGIVFVIVPYLDRTAGWVAIGLVDLAFVAYGARLFLLSRIRRYVFSSHAEQMSEAQDKRGQAQDTRGTQQSKRGVAQDRRGEAQDLREREQDARSRNIEKGDGE